MKHRVVLGSARGLLSLPVLLGAAWWVVMLQRGAFRGMTAGVLTVLVVLFILQVVAWCLVGGLLSRVSRAWSSGRGAGLALLALVLVVGNGLFYFTPTVGSPVLATCCLIAAVMLLAARSWSAA